MINVIQFERLQDRIVQIRGQSVLLDADVAELYGVATRDINKAVANNLEKFPEGYVFALVQEEKNVLVENFHRFERLKHSTVQPKAFPERGLYMLATILKGQAAVRATLAIVETFARMRELSRNIHELTRVSDRATQQSLMRSSGEILSGVLGDDLKTSDVETSIELNFAVLKFSHTIKKRRRQPSH